MTGNRRNRDMSRQPPPIAPQIIDQASEWFVAMRDGVTEDKRTAFVDWLRASPTHVQAYLEIGKVWADAKHISSEISAEAPTSSANVVALRDIAEVLPSSDSGLIFRRPGLRRLAWAASFLAA